MPDSPFRCRAPGGSNVELEAWLDVVREAHARGAHVDLLVIGDEDSLTPIWSACSATTDRRAFLAALIDTIEMDAADDVGGSRVVH